MKPVIAVDVDDVLANFISALVLFHNHTYNTSLTPANFHSYDFHHVWGGTKEEANAKMDLFFESSYYYDVQPIPQAREALQILAQHFELHVVTARHNAIQESTRQFISTHYPNIFVEVHFGNMYMTDGTARKKSEICRAINAQLLIDDSLFHAMDCCNNGILSILFGNYAWNCNEPGGYVVHTSSREVIPHTNGAPHTNIHRVTSWAEVVPLISHLLQVPIAGSPPPSLPVTEIVSTVQPQADLIIALIQLSSTDNIHNNVALIDQYITLAMQHSPRPHLICLPESALYIGSTPPVMTLDDSGAMSGDGIKALLALTEQHNVHISLGGVRTATKAVSDDVFHNSHILLSPTGDHTIYHKSHLFRFDPSQLSNSATERALDETHSTTPGNRLVTTRIAGVTIGLGVCYDLRFPKFSEAYRKLGAEVILFPSAFMVTTGQAGNDIRIRYVLLRNTKRSLAYIVEGPSY